MGIWKKLSLLPCLPALVFAAQSLQSGTGTSAKNLPVSAPWTNLSNWRAEVRIHNFTSDNTYQTIFGTNAFALRLGPSNSAVITSWKDGSAACSVNFANHTTDVIVRFQRDGANSRLTVEAWNAADGSGYLQAVGALPKVGIPDDSGSSITLGGFKGSVAYVRIYSTVVPLQTAPGNKFDGDLLDYELEGNGNEMARSMNLTMASAVYMPTPAYSPAALFGQYPAPKTFLTGGNVTVDGSSTFTANDNAVLTYSWQQISGPSAGSFANPTARSTTFTASTPGTYTLQLTATDNLGNSGTQQVKYGVVSTDENGFVSSGDPALDYILGPLTMWGTSPWPWYDLTERADADSLLPYQTKYPNPGTQLSGTLTVTTVNGNIYIPPAVVGTGTHFTTELKPGDGIGFAWPAPDGLTGQWRANVVSIADDTHLSVDNPGNPRPFPFTNINAFKIDRSQYIFWGDNQNVSTNWNFYDDALALYRLYYRTGIDDYQNAARTLADGWYHYALDHGYNPGQVPHFASMQGIILRALDGHPEYWNGILYYMNYPLSWSSQFSRNTPYPAGSQIEPRENGYMLRWAALIARLHPDPAIRAQWCTSIANSVTNVWPYVQDDLGNFEEDVYNENPSYPYKAYQGRFGSSPWRGTIALLGLQQAYDVLNDPSACNHPDVANQALAVMTGFADFVHDYGTGSGRGQLYSVGFETIGQDPLASPGFNQSTPTTAGTLAVTPGSVVVTGAGTNFGTIFWGVNGVSIGKQGVQYGAQVSNPTKYIGIPAGNGCNLVFTVDSVQSDTQLTMQQPWPSTCPAASKVTSSVGWVATWEGQKNCFSLAAYCEGGPAGDRSLTHDIHDAYLWTWMTTGVQKYYDWANDSLGADYGGPAGGPGAHGPGAGPLADGGTGNFSDPLPPCSSPPPCGGYGPVSAMGKALGMSAGAGNADNAIAIYTAAQAAGQASASGRPIRPMLPSHRKQ